MNVIGHDNRGVKLILGFIVVAAASQNDFPRPFWQDQAMFCNEGYEMGLVVTLKMRQITAIKCHLSFLG